MKKLTIIALAIALLVPTLVMAQRGPRGGACDGNGPRVGDQKSCQMGPRFEGRRGQKGHPGLLAMADELGLTEDQISKIKDLQDEFQMDRIDKRAEIEKAQLTVRKLRSQDNVSKPDLFRAIDDLARLKADMQKTAFEHQEAVKAVLTSDQLGKMKEFRDLRRMDDRRGGPGAGSEFEQQRQRRMNGPRGDQI